MRLFKSNKSQASIDRSSGSHDGSPTHSEAAYPQAQTQTVQPAIYSGAQFTHSQHPDRFDQPVESRAHQDNQVQSHPAHILSRSQSSRVPSSGAPSDAYARRPSVSNLQPLTTPATIHEIQGSEQVPGQTQFGQSRNVHTEKEHKRSKRSIFGLTSSKDREREREKESQQERKTGLGRAGSVNLLTGRKQPQLQVAAEQSPQSPTHTSPQYSTARQSVYQVQQENQAGNVPEDLTRYEQYRPQQQGQFDSPQSQQTHYSPEYAEDAPQFGDHQEQYQAYHQESSNTSEQYLPYPGQHAHPNTTRLENYQNLRPPSQSSLGPPSPILNAGLSDSRPSTAATSRYSIQSINTQQQPQQISMARGDATNGNLRQQINQQRDPRADEHGQYQSQQDNRMRMSQQVGDQGRNTPPPPRNRDDIGNLDYHQLLQRHEELQAKYSKVKRYYFEREAQVTQLQNTVANQRLSMSKTSLDDAQYSARFERLSGAIMNLSFNIRKDWRHVPPWLRHVCNQDAHSVGTKEMTAVGRACVTRWLYETIFERCFHPALADGLSSQLKNIERNLRRSGTAGVLLTDEQRDELVTKMTTWRLTTIEGLQDILASRYAEQNVEYYTRSMTEQLTMSLKANLVDPPPPGLSEGISTIVSQAVSIAANLPLESRDICIEYFMPGTPVNETYMKIETGIVPLSNPGPDERLSMAMQQQQQQQEGEAGDDASTEGGVSDVNVEEQIREAAGKASQPSTGQAGGVGGNGGSGALSAPPGQRTDSVASLQSSHSQSTIKSGGKEQKKGGFLGGFVNKKPAPSQTRTVSSSEQRLAPDPSSAESGGGGGNEGRSVRESMAVDPSQLGSSAINLGGSSEGKIRFATFLAVEVRGKGKAGAGAGEDKSAAGGDLSAGQASAGVGVGRTTAAAAAAAAANVNVLCKAPVYEF